MTMDNMADPNKVIEGSTKDDSSTDGGASPGADEKPVKDNDDKPIATIQETLSFVYRCGWRTRLLVVCGTLGGIGNGLTFPIKAFLLAKSFQTLSRVLDDNHDPMQSIRDIAYTFMLLGTYSLLMAFIQTFCFALASYNAGWLLQLEWFRALLRQDSAYYDVYSNAAGMAAAIGPSVLLYTKGVGRKFGEGIQNFVAGFSGLLFALYSTYSVSLNVLTILPVISAGSYFAIAMNQTKSARAAECYREAGNIAYSTIASIKTILSLNAAGEMIRRYQRATQEAFENATGILWTLGFFNGFILGSFILLLCLVVLVGSFFIYREVRDSGCDPAGGTGTGHPACATSGADVFGAMLGILFAGQAMSQVGHAWESFSSARGVAAEALNVIQRQLGSPAKIIYKENNITAAADKDDGDDDNNKDQDSAKSDLSRAEEGHTTTNMSTTTTYNNKEVLAILPSYEIDPFSKDGLQLEHQTVEGNIEFRNVTFAYPTRPSETILKNFHLQIPAGKTVAIVGPSGGGKSTILALIERFYDPLEGCVMFDGTNIKELSLPDYRKFLGYVGQEPFLFDTTIRENIAYGVKDGQITQEQIEMAARKANAHDFIMSFPKGYDTPVGNNGTQISGGQKQRLAIARVLAAAPAVLCLDEATSALDPESELFVQDALDKILAERALTTIIVAHRLSTIRSADIIFVVSGGTVVESGSHEELMTPESLGYYRKLVEKQEHSSQSEQQAQEQPLLPRLASFLRESFVSASSMGVDDGDDTQSSDFLASSGAMSAVPVVRPLVEQPTLIEFRNTQFSYPSRPNKRILRDFSLSIKMGETVALVGPSGGGKSTTAALVMRFYDPSCGVVEYKGRDIKTLNVKLYRDQLGYVGQEPTLFPGTIAENITLGAPGATRKAIEEAARQANAHDFISGFPDGYDTQVGGGQAQFSGGQKQRIAIARALIKEAAVIVLDEATSALDSESESTLQAAISNLMAQKQTTLIIIAHKLATIRQADRIAFISGGELLELGSHDELMASKGSGDYKRFVHAQERGSAMKSMGLSRTFESESEPRDDVSEGEDDPTKIDMDETKQNPGVQSRVRQMASPEIGYVLLGSIGAIMSGASYPLMGLLFAQTIDLFYGRVEPCPDSGGNIPFGFASCSDFWSYSADEMRTRSFKLALLYFLLVLGALFGSCILTYGLGQANERLTKRIRDSTFAALIRQEVGFFDRQNVGKITSDLQESAARLQAFYGAPVRQFFEATSSVLIGLLLSFVLMWPYALLCIGCMIPMSYTARLRRKTFAGEDEGSKDSHKVETSAGGILVEASTNMRTIAALSLEEKILHKFEAALLNEEDQKSVLRDSMIAGVMSGLGNFIQRFTNALLYFWGGYLMIHYPSQYSFNSFLVAHFAFLLGTLGLGAALQDLDDRQEVEQCAARIFSILDRKSEIDPLSDEGEKLDRSGAPLGRKDHEAKKLNMDPLDKDALFWDGEAIFV